MATARQTSAVVLASAFLVLGLSGCAHRPAHQPIPQGTIKRYADDICEVNTMSADYIIVAMKDGAMTGDIAHTFTHENFPLPAGSALLHHDDLSFVGISYVPPNAVDFMGAPIEDEAKRQSNIALAKEAYENCKHAPVSSEKLVKDGSPFLMSVRTRN